MDSEDENKSQQQQQQQQQKVFIYSTIKLRSACEKAKGCLRLPYLFYSPAAQEKAQENASQPTSSPAVSSAQPNPEPSKSDSRQTHLSTTQVYKLVASNETSTAGPASVTKSYVLDREETFRLSCLLFCARPKVHETQSLNSFWLVSVEPMHNNRVLDTGERKGGGGGNDGGKKESQAIERKTYRNTVT